VRGQSIHVDERGVVAELALERDAAIAPHSNPNLSYFLVIEGGGFVRVGDETARVSAGEAVVWPPDVVHAAWTEASPMRAIVVEFAATAADRVRVSGAREERLLAAGVDVLEPVPANPETTTAPTASDEGEPW
jgi:quercetin dioxygenase-like cupin family protein